MVFLTECRKEERRTGFARRTAKKTVYSDNITFLIGNSS